MRPALRPFAFRGQKETGEMVHHGFKMQFAETKKKTKVLSPLNVKSYPDIQKVPTILKFYDKFQIFLKVNEDIER
ncbi:hypothetical protein [Leptospira sp. serovar Kenya]|uniref:hypothetical protein n=1 Tax=Leptospira sp. serovar Kenya TaxID=1242990 RepID=UPI0003448C80|nr:hypothetical protein [Leptospira sp. serovar Kenya]